jgi:hypothetical protein
VSNLGAPGQTGEGLAGALVDGLAARAESLDVPGLTAAVGQIRERSGAGRIPVGLQRLAEVLNPGLVPAPRQPIGDLAGAADCVRRNPATVLDTTDPATVARVVAALVGDGLRLLVTGPDADELAAVRAALPPETAGLCLDGPQPLIATELRELRVLLATRTRERAGRARQLLPDPSIVPDPDEVAELCTAAGRPGYPPTTSAELVPELLGQLPAHRLNALIETAKQCDVAVSALNRDGEAPWSWDLLEALLFGQSWQPFERLVALCTETIDLADGLRDAGDQLAVVGTIEPDDLVHLRRYADFLDAGGHARSYFRSPEQRAAEPVLRQLRLDNAPLKSSKILRQALAFVQLIADVDRIGDECRELDLPEPRDIPAVTRLLRRLETVAEAVRAVEILRHEVLFIHPTSPVSMPDMEATEAVAKAIINSGSAAEMSAARRRLTELAERFGSTLPARLHAETVRVESLAELEADEPDSTEPVPAPEYLAAVNALREHKVPEYVAALQGLARARHDRVEERRLRELLDRLREAAPGLAEAWQRTGGRTFAPGTVRLRPVAEVLAELPDADTIDVVLLTGADRLDPGYLAVAASAPRLLVASADVPGPPGVSAPNGGPGGLAGRLAAAGETAGSMLRRAGVPLIAAAERPAPPNGGSEGSDQHDEDDGSEVHAADDTGSPGDNGSPDGVKAKESAA